MAIFRFTQEQYNVDETNGEACVCLELISGILALDIIIEVSKEEDYDIAMECKYKNRHEYFFLIIIIIIL